MLKKVTLILFCVALAKSYTPIVLWHGMGDSAIGLNNFKQNLENELPGVHVVSLMIGDTITEDRLNSFFMHPDKQIEIACTLIQSDPLLADGYNSIGFSQGSQFLRALIQRCPSPQMKNLVSFGGQHQGVYGIPLCTPVVQFCDDLRVIVNKLVYNKFIQKLIAQSTYWHNPLDEEGHRQRSTFIADINNEDSINPTYIDNLQLLENMILIKFKWDQMVIPQESQWFGFYKPNQSEEVVPVQDLAVYTRLGLDKLERDGKLQFLSTPGFHLSINWNWFVENVLTVYLNK